MYEQSAEEASINCNFCCLIILRKTTLLLCAQYSTSHTHYSWKFTISPRVGMSSASTIFNIWAFTIQH